jgi:hypothetical protein
MSGNSLVAGPADLTTPFSGTFMLESGEALCAAISNGDWVAGGIAAFSLAMDGISMALDPIGSLIAMGLGWLMDHIEPLKGWLNDLTGDAGEVAGFASTWQNIATHLQQAGESLEASLRGLASMQGQAADAFRAFHADAARHLAASGEWAGAIGTGMTIASTIVKMVHDMTRDAISTVVGTAASAAITTVATLGFGAPVAVAQVTSKVASLVGRLTKFVTNLLRSVKQLVQLTEKLVDVFRRLMTSMAGAIRNIPTRTPDVPSTRPPGIPHPPGGQTPAPRPSRREQLDANTAQGARYADEQAALDAQRLDGFQREISIRFVDGDGMPQRFRIDGIGVNPSTGRIELIEYKSSLTAPLTPRQADGFPAVWEAGGIVTGAGKGDFTGGVVIPSGTRVEIRRPH